MRFRKTTLLGVTAISLAVIALSIMARSSQDGLHLPFVKKVHYNSISGIEGSDGPVLVVKIDDTQFARPQVGIDEADLVYIEQVEGGLTRLAAVFSRVIPSTIGPVRSARITDIDLLSQYGYVAFAYSGAQSKLRPILAASNFKDVGAERSGALYYKNDPLRNQPYAMMFDAPAMMKKLSEDGVPIAHSRSMGWNFGDKPESGTVISEAKISWPAASYTVTWSKEQERWLISNGGVPNLAASGKQLGASTFVIQLVEITPSEYRDKGGGVTPLSRVIGRGSGFILRDGYMYPALWERTGAESGTRWYDMTGKEITFARGQIWVALTDKTPLFNA